MKCFKGHEQRQRSKRILNFKEYQELFCWDVIFIAGGGMVLAAGAKVKNFKLFKTCLNYVLTAGWIAPFVNTPISKKRAKVRCLVYLYYFRCPLEKVILERILNYVIFHNYHDHSA